MKSDRELVRDFQKDGDESAFDELVARHYGHAYQIAYGTLGNREDAEEVVQDTFLRIHRALPAFRGDSEFSTWMYRIVINLCNNKFRWNRIRGCKVTDSIDAPLNLPGKYNTTLKIEIPDRQMPPDKQYVFDETNRRLHEAMQRLPESYREAVLLRNVKQLDYEQIARILNCAIGTVKSRISRGRDLLREYMEL